MYRDYKQNQSIYRYNKIKEEEAHNLSIGILVIGGLILLLILVIKGGV